MTVSGKIKLLVAAGAAAVLVVGTLLITGAFSDHGKALVRVRSSDPQERMVALNDLAERPSRRGDEALLNAFSDSDARVAARAVIKVGNWTHRDGLAHVVRAMDDPRPQVRAAAVASVGKLHLREKVDAAPVIKMLADSSQPREVRATAARSLGRLHSWEAMPQLVAALDDPNPHVRGQAGAAIRKILGRDYHFRANAPNRREKAAEIRAVWPGLHKAHLDYMRRLKEQGK